MNRRDLLRHLLVNSGSLAGAIVCSHCYTPARQGEARPLAGSDPQAPGPLLPPPSLRQPPPLVQEPLRPRLPQQRGVGPLAEGDCEYSLTEEIISQPYASTQLGPLPAKSYHHGHGAETRTEAELNRTRNFDMTHPGDLFIRPEQRPLLDSASRKLEQVGRYVGFGHFNLLSFEEAIGHAKRAPRLEAFTPQEIAFCEEVFAFEADKYGFYGKKLVPSLNTVIKPRDVIKIPHSGHYLYRDVSLPIYERIIKDVGNTLILTSGIRGTVKQMHLFFVKARSSDGNLSQASRSLAPPGYSYHAVGDFDVGKIGLGLQNFTNKFSETDEYRKLIDLGYIDIRYPFDNPFGVRFEPWHILGAERRV